MLLRGNNQVVAHGHLAKDLQGLKGAANTPAAQCQRRQAGDVLTMQFNRAFIKADLPQHAVEHGGFTRAVGANHTKNLAGHDFKRHPAHRLNGSVGFFKVADL